MEGMGLEHVYPNNTFIDELIYKPILFDLNDPLDSKYTYRWGVDFVIDG
jgi:hypothetical protein